MIIDFRRRVWLQIILTYLLMLKYVQNFALKPRRMKVKLLQSALGFGKSFYVLYLFDEKFAM